MHFFLSSIQQLFDKPILRVGTSVLTLSTVAQFLLTILIALLFSIGFKHLLANPILKRFGFKQGTRESISTITSYSLGTLLGLILLQSLGVRANF